MKWNSTKGYQPLNEPLHKDHTGEGKTGLFFILISFFAKIYTYQLGFKVNNIAMPKKQHFFKKHLFGLLF